MKEFIELLPVTQIMEEHKQQLNSPITLTEIKAAIQRLKKGKSPGCDGFTAEFYKILEEDIINHLLKIYNSILEGGEVPESWKLARIIVIPKQGKDNTSPSAYRPITLQNQDQKFFSSILAQRMNMFITKYIHTDQYGFMPDRRMADAIRRVLNIIYTATKEKQKIAILSLDVLKAFDRLEWRYMFQLMGKMNMGERFIRTLKSLYEGASAKIMINGYESEKFKLQRGTRQGDPLSPLIFAIAIEPLASCIRINDNIEGVTVKDRQYNINLYAFICEGPIKKYKIFEAIIRKI